MRPTQVLFALLAVLLAACQSANTASIPEPFPEALEWAMPQQDGGGVFLGLKTRENDTGSLDDLFFEPGVRVTRVVENSPAADAGFLAGDVVLGWGEHDVDDPGALENLLQEAGAGAELRVRVQRDDSVFEVPVVLGGKSNASAPQAELMYRVDPMRSRAGWLTGRGGAVLVSSAPQGPFLEAGVEIGSVVTAIEGAPVLSARALIRTLETYGAGARVDVTLTTPAGENSIVEVQLQEQPTQVTGYSIPILVHYDADADGEETSFVLIDLYVISLFRYTRVGVEKEWRFLRWLRFSSGVGELSE